MTASQAQAPGIWFVYRSHREGPLGKRVRRVAAASILAWFQAKIEEARTSLTPHRVADADLGGPVHGLAALFEAAKQHSLHTPKSSSALTKLLHEHLHGDGSADEIKVDAHAVRVFSNDDDGETAWFFFDDEALRKSPRNLAFLLHDEARLPDGDADRPFAAAALTALGPAGSGEGATYACLLTTYGRRSLVGRTAVISGVRLPEVAAHLGRVTPDATPDGHDEWPVEVRLLRALIEDGETKLAPALKRAAAYPLAAVVAKGEHAHLGAGALDAARAELAAAAEGLAPGGDPAQAIVFEGEHAALLAVPTSAQPSFESVDPLRRSLGRGEPGAGDVDPALRGARGSLRPAAPDEGARGAQGSDDEGGRGEGAGVGQAQGGEGAEQGEGGQGRGEGRAGVEGRHRRSRRGRGRGLPAERALRRGRPGVAREVRGRRGDADREHQGRGAVQGRAAAPGARRDALIHVT
ncbi:MAG: hypothetical protein QM820_11840 [Minicystis sp.]